MTLTLWPTLAIFGLCLGLFLLSRHIALRPVELGRPRLLPWTAIQIAAGFVGLLMLVHLLTLAAGHPITGSARHG